MKMKRKTLLFLSSAALITAAVTPVALVTSCEGGTAKLLKEQQSRIQDLTNKAQKFVENKLVAKEYADKKTELKQLIDKLKSADIKDPKELKKIVDEFQSKYNEIKSSYVSLDELRKDDSKYVDEIEKLYNEFTAGRDNQLSETGGALTDQSKVNLLKYEKDFLKKAEDFKSSGLSTSETVWVNEIITLIKQDIKLVESDIRYIGGDASTVANDDMLKFFWGQIYWSLSDKSPEFIDQLIKNLKTGITKGITNSKVYVKRGVAKLLAKGFRKQLINFLKSSKTSVTLEEFLNDESLMGRLNPDQENYKKFMLYYGVEYIKSAHGGDIPAITLSKTNESDVNSPNYEKEDTISLPLGTAFANIYGLGYTNADLNAKNIGIGGMKNKEAAKKIYDAMLYANLTIEKSAQDIYNIGVERSKGDLEAFKFIANKVATLITGSESADWTPTVRFNAGKLDPTDENPSETKLVKLNIRVDGKLNLDQWYKWIMQDDFYYGLDAWLTDAKAKEMIADPANAEYIKQADRAGFKKYRNPNATVLAPEGTDPSRVDEKGNLLDENGNLVKLPDQPYLFNKSITNRQMYASGLEALKQYNIWKHQTQDLASSFFESGIPSVNVVPVAEDSYDLGSYRTSKGEFFFNLKPYLGLPKWSTTSFTNHESKMGHHNQLWYTRSHAAKEGGKSFEIFDSTAYAEGWALFVEWFAIESGWYGTPDYSDKDNYDKIPKDFYHAIDNYLPPLKNDSQVSQEEIKYLQEVAGGVYWELAGSEQKSLSDTERAKIAIQIGNLMQYYGAINESTMRDNRLALDTAVHGVIDKPNDYIGSGISINEERVFMKKHLQLPSDINAYPKRYLGYPAQATSYNTGKEVMKNIYKRVQQASGKSREEFAKDKDTLKVMFHLYLSYGNIPLDALEELVLSQMIPDSIDKY